MRTSVKTAQRTMNPSARTADTFNELQKALGALSFANTFNGCISKSAYYRSSTAYNLCAAYNAFATATASLTMTAPNQFYLAVDTEVVARKDNLLNYDLGESYSNIRLVY